MQNFEWMKVTDGILLDEIWKKKKEYIIENTKTNQLSRAKIHGKVCWKSVRGETKTCNAKRCHDDLMIIINWTIQIYVL